MSIVSFAQQSLITHNGQVFQGNNYITGPFKIVHHTTEGGTAAGAIATYAQTGSMPHFTVDGTHIYQHVDTSKSVTALKDLDGGVRTNRDSAIQIEVVGFAAQAKSAATLANIARLCRWLEMHHQVAREWPNGYPLPSASHHHNRNAVNWNTKSGHYGHSQVPENSHTDPGYTQSEVIAIMGHDPVEIVVNGIVVMAHAFLETGVVWAAAQPLLAALGGSLTASNSLNAGLSRGSQHIQVPARGVDSGSPFVRVREFRQFTNVQVDYDPGPPQRITIVG